MGSLLFTGFPGILARELVPRVLSRARDDTAICLARPSSLATARRLVEEWELADRTLRGRIRVAPADIARPGLGLEDDAAVVAGVTTIFHLAGVSHPGLPREAAARVNVGGTAGALALAERCPSLERFHHLSTCFVSGRFAGLFSEADLDRGQSFHNGWEETRFRAETDVRARMEAGFPATIYRVPCVVGDASTGETQSFGGAYWLLRWVLRQPLVAVVPVGPAPGRVRPNLVPRDFVADAIAHLSALPQSRGRTYHLADPSPPALDEVLAELGRATGRRVIGVRAPVRAVRAALARLPGAAWLTGVPPAALDYLTHPAYYGTENARADLGGTEIRVPPLARYVDRLVAFFRRHRATPWEPEG